MFAPSELAITFGSWKACEAGWGSWLGVRACACRWCIEGATGSDTAQCVSPIDFGIKGSDSKHLRLYDCGITELRCRSCSLRGTLPIGLSQLTRLVLLDLGSNALSGTIDAASLSGLGALRILILRNNNLEGHLPPSLFNPTPLLETIDLN